MVSWKNATGSVRSADLTRSGVLRPGLTTRVADLRRDAPVSPALQPFVERYWSVRWDRTGQSPFRSEVLSHPSVNVSVETGTHPRFGARCRPSSCTVRSPAGSPSTSSVWAG